VGMEKENLISFDPISLSCKHVFDTDILKECSIYHCDDTYYRDSIIYSEIDGIDKISPKTPFGPAEMRSK